MGKELYHRIPKLIEYATEACRYFHMQNNDMGIRRYNRLVRWIQISIDSMSAFLSQNQLQELVSLLGDMIATQTAEDYELLADLVEVRLFPILTGIAQKIWNESEKSVYADYYETNLSEFEKAGCELVSHLEAYRKNQIFYNKKLEVTENPADAIAIYDALLDREYHMEDTACAIPVLRVVYGNKSIYLHGNANPYRESMEYAAEVMRDFDFLKEDCEEVIRVVGFGSVCNVIAVGNYVLQEIPIVVYEEDLNVIRMALQYYDLTGCSKYLKIVYDPDYLKLAEDLRLDARGKNESRSRLIVQKPSVDLIRKDEVRQSFRRFFVQNASHRNTRLLLGSNFRANTSELGNRVCYGGKLKEEIQGKRVVIIAAGPSLDRNIAQLQESVKADRGDLFILASGTVLKKLCAMGLFPDAVIVSDPNERVVHQIRGMDANVEKKVPLIVLSTAAKEFIREYSGEKYLIYQNGFEPAEKAAKDSSYGLEAVETGGSVATTAMEFARAAMAKQIIFMGLDLAFTDDLAHAEGTSNRIATDRDNLMPVLAWHPWNADRAGTVYTDSKFTLYRKWFERILNTPAYLEKGDDFVINATEGGSYIQGMHHQKLSEIL